MAILLNRAVDDFTLQPRLTQLHESIVKDVLEPNKL